MSRNFLVYLDDIIAAEKQIREFISGMTTWE